MKCCNDVNIYFCTDFHNIETPNSYYISFIKYPFHFLKKNLILFLYKNPLRKIFPGSHQLDSLFFSFRIYASFSSQGPDNLFRIIIIIYLFLMKNITKSFCIKSFLAQFAAIQVRI